MTFDILQDFTAKHLKTLLYSSLKTHKGDTMTIVGFNYTKMLAEKSLAAKGKVNITSNLSIKEVEEASFVMGTEKQDSLKFNFQFETIFAPEFGKINLDGSVIYLDTKEKVQETLKTWKKTKKLPKDVMQEVVNSVLNRCNVQALIMSRDMNMPSPIPLPKVSIEA